MIKIQCKNFESDPCGDSRCQRPECVEYFQGLAEGVTAYVDPAELPDIDPKVYVVYYASNTGNWAWFYVPYSLAEKLEHVMQIEWFFGQVYVCDPIDGSVILEWEC